MALKLLEPILIGSKYSKNRIVLAPMETRLSTITGDITQGMIDYYAQRAKGGAGMIIVENTFVDDLSSRSSFSSSGLYSDHLIAGKNLIAEAIKKYGALAVIQLSHGGRQAKQGATAYDAVAPSAVMCSVTKRMPRILKIEEIVAIEDAFASTAFRAKQAGFDGVEIHGAHGYLICSFLSPLTNLRKDEYGGSLENRGRFAVNIMQKIREKVGPDFIVGYRISASEYIKGGLEPDEASAFVVSVQEHLDYINVTAGIYESPSFWAIASTYIPQGQIVHLAHIIKKAVSIPVIAVGSLNPALAEKVLQDGKADMIAFGRALIADPFMPKKLKEGRPQDVRPCIRGNEGCISRFYDGCAIRCEVNPACGQESTYNISKAGVPKKVLIAGGGISGMEAARVASLMGHSVTLVEKEKMLGGHIIESINLDFKENEAELFKWLLSQVEKSGAKILLNTVATPELIAGEKPDFLILALGSSYIRPSITGAQKALLAGDVLVDNSLAGKKVIVVGGGLVGSETALALSSCGRNVTLVEMTKEIAQKHEAGTRESLIMRLKNQNVCILTGHTVTEIDTGYIVATDQDGTFIKIEADTVIAATGLASLDYQELANIIPNTVCIGDCVQARKIYNCMHEAWDAVMNISSDEYI